MTPLRDALLAALPMLLGAILGWALVLALLAA